MATTADVPKPGHAEASSETAPLVVDLGKKSRKRVRKLRRGEGPLLAEVIEVIDELKQSGTVAPDARPVIVVVRQKGRCRGGLLPRL